MSLSLKSCFVLTCVVLFATALSAGSDRPLTPQNAKFDPSAKQVEMFQCMMSGALKVKLVAKDSTGGSLFLSNQTPEPLTVKLPEGFAAVPVSAQFGNPGFGNSGLAVSAFGNSGTNGMNNTSGQQTGMQSLGGGTGINTGTGFNSNSNPFGSGPSGANNIPPGFFSIPAGKTLRVPFVSVCLNHGLNDPVPQAEYVVMPVEEYTDDPVLQSLIAMVGSGKLDQKTAQAATWHIANGLNWQQLAAKGKNPIRVPGDNYFTKDQLRVARDLVEVAQAKAAGRTEERSRLANSPLRNVRGNHQSQ